MQTSNLCKQLPNGYVQHLWQEIPYGEIAICERCRIKKCRECGGNGWDDCPRCGGGRSHAPCPHCNNLGTVVCDNCSGCGAFPLSPDEEQRIAIMADLRAAEPASGASIPDLVELVLQNSVPPAYEWMSDQLRQRGERAVSGAVTSLAQALHDPSKLVRLRAARFLAHLGTAACPAIPDLRECSQDADVDVRMNCCSAIKAIGAS